MKRELASAFSRVIARNSNSSRPISLRGGARFEVGDLVFFFFLSFFVADERSSSATKRTKCKTAVELRKTQVVCYERGSCSRRIAFFVRVSRQTAHERYLPSLRERQMRSRSRGVPKSEPWNSPCHYTRNPA